MKQHYIHRSNTIPPAWPILRPGGAVSPAIKATTGFSVPLSYYNEQNRKRALANRNWKASTIRIHIIKYVILNIKLVGQSWRKHPHGTYCTSDYHANIRMILTFIRAAASSSAVPPISPIRTIPKMWNANELRNGMYLMKLAVWTNSAVSCQSLQ